MTGRYPSAIGVNTNGNDYFPREAEDTLLSRLLARANYDCGLVGKLHIAGAADRKEPRVDDGFRVFEWSHSPRPLWRTQEHAYAAWLVEKGLDPEVVLHLRDKRKDRAIVPSSERDNVPPEYHHLTWVGERATDFIRSARRPWLLCVNTFEPHPPFNPPYEYYRRFDPGTMPGPAFREEDIEQQMQFERAGVDFQTSATHPAEIGGQELQAAYYAMVEFVDEQLGRLIQTLEETNQRADTLVLFTSDHGEMLGDHGLVQKGCRFYDGLIRVPMIWSWPGRIAENVRSDALVELTDLAPTLLQSAGLPVPEQMQGRSFASILQQSDDNPTHRQSVRSEYIDALGLENHSRATMYFDGTWKLVQYHGTGLGELYNLLDDPHEFTNLWEVSSTRRLRDELIRHNHDRTIESLDPGIRVTRPY